MSEKFYDSLVAEMDAMSDVEKKELLKSLISENDVKAQENGSLIDVVVHGLSAFNLSTNTVELGLEADDPRAKRWQSANGYLIDRDYILRLRNISQRRDNIARNAGGVRVGRGDKFLYWIPNKGLADFQRDIFALQSEFDGVVTEIEDNYEKLRVKALDSAIDAASAAWDALSQKGSKNLPDKSDYIDRTMSDFNKSFIKKNELHQRICIDVFLTEKNLHPSVSRILRNIKAENAVEDVPMNLLELLNSVGSRADIENIKNKFRRASVLSTESRVSVEIEKMITQCVEDLECLSKDNNGRTMRKARMMLDRIAKHKGANPAVDNVILKLQDIILSGMADDRDIMVLKQLVTESLQTVEDEIRIEAASAGIAALAATGEHKAAIEEVMRLRERLDYSVMMADAIKSKVAGYMVAEE